MATSAGIRQEMTLSWWRHQIETFSALLALFAGNLSVTDEFHARRPVTRSLDVFFDLRLNKRLSKQPRGWWFQTPSCSLWRHCDDEHWGLFPLNSRYFHNSDVIMSVVASHITSLTIVYYTVCSGADQRKYQSSAPLACLRGIHR